MMHTIETPNNKLLFRESLYNVPFNNLAYFSKNFLFLPSFYYKFLLHVHVSFFPPSYLFPFLSSRLLLGALVHSHAILIIDSSLSDANQLTSFLDAVKLFLKEQVSAIAKFNIIRYSYTYICNTINVHVLTIHVHMYIRTFYMYILCHVTRRCTGGLTSFADNLLKVLPGVVQEGIEWLGEAHSSSSNAPMTNNLIEAVTRAIACEGVSYINKYW